MLSRFSPCHFRFFLGSKRKNGSLGGLRYYKIGHISFTCGTNNNCCTQNRWEESKSMLDLGHTYVARVVADSTHGKDEFSFFPRRRRIENLKRTFLVVFGMRSFFVSLHVRARTCCLYCILRNPHRHPLSRDGKEESLQKSESKRAKIQLRFERATSTTISAAVLMKGTTRHWREESIIKASTNLFRGIVNECE